MSLGMREAASEIRVYEEMAIREAWAGSLRPGGLELTQRAICVSSLGHGSRVLDIGCGRGVTLHYLIENCGFRAAGIDPSEVLLAEGNRNHLGLPLVRASGADLPFADAAMDAVLAECSLSVMEDVGKVLAECSRVLKHDGVFLVHDVYARNPSAGSGLKGLPVRCCLTGAVSREEWIARLEGCGFAVTVWEDHSIALKEFAARLIFSCGSLSQFWGRSQSGPGTEDCRRIQHAISSIRPGYFLLMAEKRNGQKWSRTGS
jgi:arsenite methyltransferase